jgi:4-cresol dehydrogenase (hydroxylating) flavoprotein subunit
VVVRTPLIEVDSLRAALPEWQQLLGKEHVAVADSACSAAENATFESSNRVAAILYPESVEHVQECVRIANRHSIALYPVSTGKNWGYTSGAPTSDAVIVNLGRMNRIVEFSEELGYVTIEPGVTQAQLYEFLKARGSKLWMDATGASGACSMIGNTVERGFGHTHYSDHFGHSCNLQVVLPDGQLLDTGLGGMPGAKTAPLYRWGVGPFLDGLFSQSNLGIVTRMTMWLMPAPEYVQAFFFKVDRDEDLPAVLDAVRPLRMNGTLQSACHIGNDYKVLGGLQSYPWEETGGKTPLQKDVLAGLGKKLNFGAWNGSGALYGTKRQVAEARRLVRNALEGKVQKLQFLDERLLKLAIRFAGVAKIFTSWDISRALELLRPLFGLIQGVPTEQPMKSCYWRKKRYDVDDMNPDRDRCGLIWCSPLAPLEGVEVRKMTSICISTLLEYGFEPMISLTLLTERTVGCVVSIIYDRDVEGEDRRARECHEQLIERSTAAGYFPYRLGIQSMHVMSQSGSFGRFIGGLKSYLDPNGILAPRRYIPGA